jgi:hypothetical protein
VALFFRGGESFSVSVPPPPSSQLSLLTIIMASASHDNYYKSLPDYAEIAPYLEEDPPGFEPAIDIPPFQSGLLRHDFSLASHLLHLTM